MSAWPDPTHPIHAPRCRNPDLATERSRKREDLLAATERDLTRIKAAIATQARSVADTYKMQKHFDLEIPDAAFSFARKTDEIAAETATDGIYVVRTSLPEDTFDETATVRSYKSLSLVERAFRCIKTVDLHIRPVYHWLADRVRGHVHAMYRPPAVRLSPAVSGIGCFSRR